VNNTSETGPVKSFALTGADQAIATAQVFYGVIVTNNSGTAVNIHIHNSADNTGAIIAGVHVTNNNSADVWYGPNGIACPNGVYVDAVSGTPTGSVLYR